MRWGIEVFFSDSKRLLGLADCSSRDFSAHIAHVSLVMIRYNMLASIKRAPDYDTIGGLFGDMYLGVHELTVVEKISTRQLIKKTSHRFSCRWLVFFTLFFISVSLFLFSHNLLSPVQSNLDVAADVLFADRFVETCLAESGVYMRIHT